jgi:anti-sigma factor RsiW
VSTSQQHDDRHGAGLLGAYVLGVLDGTEAEAVEAHLTDCATCRAEVAELRGVEEMLGEIPAEAFLDGPPEDGELMLQRTLRQVRSERTAQDRRRWASLGVAAAVAAAAVLGGGVLLGRGTMSSTEAVAPPSATATLPAPPPPGSRVLSAADATTGARMTVTLAPAAGWVRLNAAVTGVPQGRKCHLVVVGKDGSKEIAGGWLVSPTAAQHGVTLNGSAVMDESNISSIEVADTDGKVFVTVPAT